MNSETNATATRTDRVPGSVSVVVRTCDRPVLLARAVASLAAQTRRPDEVVVVNDGGPVEPVRRTVQPAGEFFAVVLLEHASPVGRSGALNVGFRAARGEWVAVLDDDDTWAPDFLETLTRTAAPHAADAGFGGVVCQTEAVYERWRGDAVVECGREPFNPAFRAVRVADLAEGNRFTINAVLWHRRVFETLGGFRVNLSVLEDWEFNVRAALRFRLEVVPRSLARYHQRPPAARAANTQARDLDRMERALREEWARDGLFGADAPSRPGGWREGLRRIGREKARLVSRVRWWFR